MSSWGRPYVLSEWRRAKSARQRTYPTARVDKPHQRWRSRREPANYYSINSYLALHYHAVLVHDTRDARDVRRNCHFDEILHFFKRFFHGFISIELLKETALIKLRRKVLVRLLCAEHRTVKKFNKAHKWHINIEEYKKAEWEERMESPDKRGARRIWADTRYLKILHVWIFVWIEQETRKNKVRRFSYRISESQKWRLFLLTSQDRLNSFISIWKVRRPLSNIFFLSNFSMNTNLTNLDIYKIIEKTFVFSFLKYILPHLSSNTVYQLQCVKHK